MSFPVGDRAEVRRNIIDSARRLFNRYGFDNVTVQQIMEGAGLPYGGFYSYFKSKSALHAKVFGCFFTDSEWKNHMEGVEVETASTEAAAQAVRAYLSREHFEDVENSCPMVALPTDVTRSGDDAKKAFEDVFGAMVGLLERSVAHRKRHTKAQAMAALCVGGMVVARAMANRNAADELRDACMSIALDLGGWGNTRALKNGTRKGVGQRLSLVTPVAEAEHRTKNKSERRGALYLATNDEAVRGFGRDDDSVAS